MRGSVVWTCVAWAATFWLTVAGMILVRAPGWDVGVMLARSWCGFDLLADAGPVSVWVLGLVGLVALGHVSSGVRGVACRLLELPPAARAAAYVGMVVLLVTLGPAAGRPFIYFVF
jgi:hypothetical protein